MEGNKDVFTLVTISTGEKAVSKNGRLAICPFRGNVVMIMQEEQKLMLNQQPNMVQQITPSPCTDSCVHFREAKNVVFLNCTLRSINIKEETKIEIVK